MADKSSSLWGRRKNYLKKNSLPAAFSMSVYALKGNWFCSIDLTKTNLVTWENSLINSLIGSQPSERTHVHFGYWWDFKNLKESLAKDQTFYRIPHSVIQWGGDRQLKTSRSKGTFMIIGWKCIFVDTRNVALVAATESDSSFEFRSKTNLGALHRTRAMCNVFKWDSPYHESNMMGQESGGRLCFSSSIRTLLNKKAVLQNQNEMLGMIYVLDQISIK